MDSLPTLFRRRDATVARQVVDFLLGKRGPLADAAEGRVCIEMILGAYESAQEGKRVAL